MMGPDRHRRAAAPTLCGALLFTCIGCANSERVADVRSSARADSITAPAIASDEQALDVARSLGDASSDGSTRDASAAPGDAGADGTEGTVAFVGLPSSADYDRWDGVARAEWQYGRPEVIRALQLVARAWTRRHPRGPRIQYLDASLREGGPFVVRGRYRHHSHREGVDVDVITRPPNITGTDHSRTALASELAEVFQRYGAQVIFYNSPALARALPELVRPFPHHDDHFHVRFDPARCPLEPLPEDR